MLKLVWREGPQQPETLANCLRALLAAAGVELPYETMVSMLGLGAGTVARESTRPLFWPDFARDAVLLQTAQLLGIRLRPLHPPQAAARLDESAEFAGHFRDSYVPLIRRALAHKQPVLAWRGWGEPAQNHWGVITEERDGQLAGMVSSDRVELLAGPALQAYVVEALPDSDYTRSPIDVFTHITRTACAWWHGQLDTAPDLYLGAAAYDFWHEIAEAMSPSDVSHKAFDEHLIVLKSLSLARAALATYLRQLSADLESARRLHAEAWASQLTALSDHLGQAAVRFIQPDESSRGLLLATIAEARAKDAEMIATLDSV